MIGEKCIRGFQPADLLRRYVADRKRILSERASGSPDAASGLWYHPREVFALAILQEIFQGRHFKYDKVGPVIDTLAKHYGEAL
jgi:hypothetical protein